eukprot:TRINITY_DN43303_c0_g1_i1.p1 TRINITY_DN43303_c0_g1~~TRINITY_DN43303_c0_g1_i1.p1  ORF type:complete len:187 (+),score=28.27 TRINITY_DN43303_c0_g1_i1:3-563(+)
MQKCKDKVVAWGECGFDYYKNAYDQAEPRLHKMMVNVFERQARLAVRLGLPLVVHARDAEEDTLQVLRECVPRDHPVHIHAFQGSSAMTSELLNMLPNCVIGVSNVVLFPHPGQAGEVAKQVPLDRLVLETDAPFLGEEPRLIPKVAAAVAKIKGLPFEDVLRATNRNCERFYGIFGKIDYWSFED